MTSKNNSYLNNLREAAKVLKKSQTEVATNWLRYRALTTYSAARYPALTKAEFVTAQKLMQRLARS